MRPCVHPDAAMFEFSSRVIQLQADEFAVLRNVNGYYAAVKIRSITDRLRGDHTNDGVSFDYQILGDGSHSFSNASSNSGVAGSTPMLVTSVTAAI